MGQQINPTGAFHLENAVCLNILPRAELEREGFFYHMEFFLLVKGLITER